MPILTAAALIGTGIAAGGSILSGVLNNMSSKNALAEQMRLYGLQEAKEDEKYAASRRDARRARRDARRNREEDMEMREEDIAHRAEREERADLELDYGKTQDMFARTSSLLNSDRDMRIKLGNLIKGRR